MAVDAINKMNTICAISTPYGSGGIAVVRVSGANAITIVDSLFHAKKSLNEAKAYTVHYGCIKHKDELLDQVLVSVFRAPHSFTGEDVVEIACHGSMYIQQTLLQWLVDAGCQLAKAGEFTQRAFLNGKMDLTEAEAVADLIAAQTKAEKDLALCQLRGGISNELAALRERLLTFTSLVELELDFADHEELEFADRSELFALAQEIDTTISNLVGSFKTGNAIKQGIPVAIIGAPNVGKSTLLNALLGEERAIVSDIHGTTRDVIEDTIEIGDTLFRFIDTAGLRETTDVIESLGIERTISKLTDARIVLWVIDSAISVEQLNTVAQRVLPHTSDDQTIIVALNKIDINATNVDTLQSALKDILPQGAVIAPISAQRGDEIDALQQHLINASGSADIAPGEVMVTNARHYQALTRAGESISRAIDGINMGISGDFIAQDVRETLHHLGEITGTITTHDILGEIFSRFCIGK